MQLQGEIDARDAKVAELQQQLTAAEESSRQEVNELRRIHLQNERELAKTADVANQMVEDKNRQVAKLEGQLKSVRDRASALERELAQLKEQAAAAPPPAKLPEQEVVRPTPPTASFPVRVYDVAGVRIVTGAHTVQRLIETDEVYRDEFGNRRKRVRPVEQVVEEYGYRVTFSVENLTAQPQMIEVRAGVSTQEFIVRPNSVLADQSVVSARGSALMVMVGGKTQRFPVSYE
jgi:hypothetical protein